MRSLYLFLSLSLIVGALPLAYVLAGIPTVSVYVAIYTPTLAAVLSLVCAMRAEV